MKVCVNGQGHMTKMVAMMAINSKKLLKIKKISFPEPEPEGL